MGIKVLMLAGDESYMIPDIQLLKDRGFWVYTCKTDSESVDVAVDELHPDIIFVNPNNPGLTSTKVYHHLLDNVRFASIPLIYTLAEDEVYLVNRKRTATRIKRNFTSDNIIDGIKIALSSKKEVTRIIKKDSHQYGNMHIPIYSNIA